MMSNTAFAAAHASALPPKVDAWGTAPPATAASPNAALSEQATAPIGMPPPSPFASVITSGVTPSCWWPNHMPVRPTPVCTSSKISSVPVSSHSLRSPAR